jgi:hypothetical protein
MPQDSPSAWKNQLNLRLRRPRPRRKLTGARCDENISLSVTVEVGGYDYTGEESGGKVRGGSKLRLQSSVGLRKDASDCSRHYDGNEASGYRGPPPGFYLAQWVHGHA